MENSDLEKRLNIGIYYSETYGKSLYSELKTKLSGNFKTLSIHLFIHPITYCAKLLKKGLKSFGADEDIILETLTSHNQEEMRQIENIFKIETGKDLIKEIEKISLEKIIENTNNNYVEFNKIKNSIREEVGKYLYLETECKPMIITVIQEV